MIASLKVFSVLLCYPTQEIRSGIPEMSDALRSEGLITGPLLDRLLRFLNDYGQRDIYDLQERYVLLFDRTRSLSLHLFEHVHGESRERGQAMVDLTGLYGQQGLTIDDRELPDYLPLFLEFASTLSLLDAQCSLIEILHIATVLEERLDKRQSPYAAVLQGIAAVARGNQTIATEGDIADLTDDDPDDLESLDEAWEDKPVVFGPESGGIAPGGACSDIRNVLAAMDPSISADGSAPEDVVSRLKEGRSWTP